MSFSTTLRLGLVLVIAGVSFAMTTTDEAEVNPKYPGKCYESQNGKAYRVGSSWYLKSPCSKHTCKNKGKKLYETTQTCDPIKMKPGCRKMQDSSKSYPGCCPKMKCS